MPFLGWPYIEGSSAWGENTSAYRFCETDFYMTAYIAEFINTLTNSGYIYLGVRGIMNTRSRGSDGVVILCYALLIFLGVGSAAYHTNVKYETQMMDEVSMLYTTAAILFAAFSTTLSRTARNSFAILLLGVMVSVSIAHCVMGEVEYFRLCFLAMVLSVFARCVWVLSVSVEDVEVKREVQQLAAYGTATFVSGFILWNIDNEFCGGLTAVREVIGMPFGFLTELHGWWHLLTGLGVYYYIVLIERLRLQSKDTTNGRANANQAILIWPGIFSLPRLDATIMKRD